ncbi:MAG: hypothetical protein LBU27_03145 [Candidatus Peribacteria bacterium]|jgi:hypothetical protein|nr:hypothetical protein [Candidatus Peribacteria bacterium]
MKTFNWDEDEELVDISEEAIQTVPTEQEIWEQFLAAFPNTNTYYLQYPMVKGEFCITSMGKVFSGYSVIELVKEIS